MSVTSLTTFWRLAADTPDTPSGADDPSGWSRTEPSIPDGYEGKLYRTIRTIMSDGTATWTSPDVDSMFEYMARTYRTASGAVTVSSEAKRTAEGNAETIKQVGTTANDALNKATTVEANLNGFKTTVSQTYTTKNDFNNLTIGGRNLLVKSNFIKTWIDTVNGTLEVPDAPVSVPGYNGDSSSKKPIVVDPDTTYILSAYDLMNGTGAYTGRISQFNSEGALINFIVPSIKIRDKGHITFTTDINAAYILVGIYAFPKCRWKLEKGTKPTDWSPAPEDLQPVGDYATNSSLTQTANSIKSQVAEVFKTANSAMSKATTVEQTANGLSSKITEQGKTLDATVKTANEAKSTADSNKTAISQVSTTANDALSKTSSLEQNLSGFKTSVAKTYQTKGDYPTKAEVQSRIDQTSRSVALGVVQNYKGADGSGLATKSDISVSRTEITSEVSNTYATKDGVSKEISSKITQNNSSLEVKFSNAGSIEYVTNGSFRENLDGWTVADGQWVINGSDNALQYHKAVSAGASTLGPWQDPSVLMGTSTRQRLIRRSFDIANYSNASGATLRMSCRLNDGTWSGEYPSVELGSTFDWMHVDMVETIPAGKYIDRVVPVIRATNACTINVEVRNFSLRDITDSYKSADAVINMTGQGVRVGKNMNGAWTGMSALVGTDATFDVLDTSGKRLLEVSATGVKFPHSKDGTRLALGYVAGSGSASDTLYIGDIITGQQEGGPKNRLGFTGDEVSLEGGDININANDNQLSLYGRKGANLLVPDGGNVQVGGQSGTSNTTLTLRGSTVNLSGGLVNVNGRTLNAPVDAKQSQRWDNIQLDVKCVNRVVTVNVLHPLGSNVIIGDQSDQCEIGYIRKGYRPSRMIGCHLAAYNTTNLFLEINPATGKVACFRLWGNQNTWAYFSASLSYVI